MKEGTRRSRFARDSQKDNRLKKNEKMWTGHCEPCTRKSSQERAPAMPQGHPGPGRGSSTMLSRSQQETVKQNSRAVRSAMPRGQRSLGRAPFSSETQRGGQWPIHAFARAPCLGRSPALHVPESPSVLTGLPMRSLKSVKSN